MELANQTRVAGIPFARTPTTAATPASVKRGSPEIRSKAAKVKTIFTKLDRFKRDSSFYENSSNVCFTGKDK